MPSKLREAASAGSYELVEALLSKSISPLECDGNADTPLHLAASNSRRAPTAANVEVCRLLLEANADSWLVNRHQFSAYDIAELNTNMGVLRLFRPTASDEDVTEFSHSASAARKPMQITSRTRSIAHAAAPKRRHLVSKSLWMKP